MTVRRASLIAAVAGALALSAQSLAAFDAASLSQIRSVSNYLLGPDAHDPNAWRRDLDGMKLAGFNTVWMVNVWAEYQPAVSPPLWHEERIAALRDICAVAAERRMNLLLVLAYVGEGWGPKGLDVSVWPLVEQHRLQHLAFLRRMAAETRDFDNVFYLLCTEEILPATVLYAPQSRRETVASFREWARRANPDVAYWNRRWGTDYSWDTLTPADTSHRPRWELWADHARWHGALMRELLPPMVSVIRQENPSAVIGFHDFLMPEAKLSLTAGDGGLPLLDCFDFYSIGYYYDADLSGGLDANLAALRGRLARARELYPSLPLFLGELGMAVPVAPPQARAAQETLQAQFLTQALTYLRDENIGFSLWSWRTVVPNAETTHSLQREDGSETPTLQAIRRLLQDPPK